MFKTTIKGLLAHKLRLVTTALAITLGVAFMAGTLVLTNTMKHTFDDLFASVYSGTDSVVRSSTVIKSDQGPDVRADIPASVLATVRSTPGVADAVGGINSYAQFLDHDGKAIGNPNNGAPTLGVTYLPDRKLNPFQVVQGSAPHGIDQVVIDKATADKYHFAIGSPITVLTATGAHRLHVVGVSKFGSADSPLGATVAMFDLTTAQRLTGKVGQFTGIRVIAQPGVSQTELTNRIQRVLPAHVQAITGDAAVKEQQQAIQNGFLSFFTTFLLVFAVIAVFVGSFVIYNTFSIIVAQRTKEMALLRAVGASRRQVMGSVVAEAAVVGVLFSGLGLFVGIGLASLLKAALGAIGLGVPSTGTVVTPSSMIVAFLIGLVVTLVVAIAPARRAAKVPPVAAMRDVEVDTTATSKSRTVIGCIVLGAGIGLLFLGLFGGGGAALAEVGAGAALTFLGVSVLGPIFARPLSVAIGAPVARLVGITGRLARQNASRNPKRTSATAAALMIGVGLVGFFTIFASSATASVNHTIDVQFHGDYLIDSNQRGDAGLPPSVATQIKTVPGVKSVLAAQSGPIHIFGNDTNVAGVDTAPIPQMADLDIRQGSLDQLGANQIAVSEDTAKAHHLHLGSQVAASFLTPGVARLEVVMIYNNADLVGDFFLSRAGYQAHLPYRNDQLVFVAVDKGHVDAVRPALDRITKPYPTATVQDINQYKAQQASQINTILVLVYVLLALAVFIALLGIMNTLALSIFERTRELGLMRAVGMSRRQVRASVRWESVIIALVGTVLGLAIGLFFGWAVVQALGSQGINTLSVPVGQLAIVVVVAAVAGVVAALLPARRAARLDVLGAIAGP
jgi:putative ABC transport system permease protein